MNELQRKIWNYLQKRAVEHANAIHVKQLADELGRPHIGRNDVSLRKDIKIMLFNEKLPIGTSQQGVYIIETESDRDIAINRICKVNPKRIDALKNVKLYNENK